jgi:hypothetical protein
VERNLWQPKCVIGLSIASVGESDSQELGFPMIAWLALAVSFIALGISIKAYFNSQWIEIDWHFEEDEDDTRKSNQ